MIPNDCDGFCSPICDWCLVGHECPTECTDAGQLCPYEMLNDSVRERAQQEIEMGPPTNDEVPF